jgi:3-deoxy-D-arabino-heptulosonate 7-phosphate (DAHP) synthase
MAEGSPVLALERGERVELPPVLYLQGTHDIAHPRPDLDRFVMQYRRAGGQVELVLFEGEAVEGRNAIQRILLQEDHRLLVIVGPCSIHDLEAALGYAGRLNALRQELADRLCVVMRVYFEKPRTTIGWKGLIYDPHFDGSDDMETELRLARQLLLAINGMGLPAGTEMLDTITPQYHADLITWAAVGARTSESQIHREMASGLSIPVGFKNSTEGNLQVAINALLEEGNQPIPVDRRQLRYGVSVTDACVGWETTERMLRHAYAQMREERRTVTRS